VGSSLISSIPITLTLSIYRLGTGDDISNAVLVKTEYLSSRLVTTFDIEEYAPGARINQSIPAFNNFVKNITIKDVPPSTGFWTYYVVPGFVLIQAPISSGSYSTSISNPDRIYVKETEYQEVY
jgi:hypothetical protein